MEEIENINGNKIIWKTENFVAVASERPLVSREEGGHIKIHASGDKYRFDSNLDFTPELVLEEKRLSQMICEAYVKAMKERGIDIIRLNFFEAGNWAWKPDKDGNTKKPFFHEHIFGRTKDAKKQKWPEAPYLPDRSTGFYDDFKPLNDEDIQCIIEEMEILEKEEKYNKSNWTI